MNIYDFVVSLCKNLIDSYRFFCKAKRWRTNNEHNYTIIKNVFQLEKVVVGKGTYGELNVFSYNKSNDEKLVIGNWVSIAKNVFFVLGGNHRTDTLTSYPLKSIIIDKSFENKEDSISKGPIIIEDEVWIGLNCVILSGVTIGKGAVIAAGSTVTKNIPPYAIAGGSPAKVIKYRFDQEIISNLLKIDLSKITNEFIHENIEDFYTPLKNNLTFLNKVSSHIHNIINGSK
jgi:virginiamycin A acetyltransferase